MDSLAQLPTEILDAILGQMRSYGDANALARTCRRLHSISNPALYRRDARQNASWALRWAGQHGCVSTAQRSLNHSGDVHSYGTDGRGATALCLAVDAGHVEMATLLIEHNSSIEEYKNNREGNRPLQMAVLNKDVAMARLLLDNGANSDCSGWVACPPINMVARDGNLAMAKLLLERGASLDPVNHCGMTSDYKPWEIAVRYGRIEVLELLLDLGAVEDVATDPKMAYWMRFSIYLNQPTDLIEFLLRRGVPIQSNIIYTNYENEFEEPLIWRAAAQCNEGMIKLLLDHGVDPYETDVEFGRTPMAQTAAEGMEDIVIALLQGGVNPNVACTNGDTTMSLAIENHGWWAVDELLAFGAHPEPFNGHEGDALMNAVKYGLYNVTRLLLQRGADTNIKDQDGRNLMWLAAKHGRSRFVEMLLTHGEGLECGDNGQEKEAIAVSMKEGHNDIAELLRQARLRRAGVKIYHTTR